MGVVGFGFYDFLNVGGIFCDEVEIVWFVDDIVVGID